MLNFGPQNLGSGGGGGLGSMVTGHPGSPPDSLVLRLNYISIILTFSSDYIAEIMIEWHVLVNVQTSLLMHLTEENMRIRYWKKIS